MVRLWLLGAGIAGSPSPAMHNAALAACGIDGRYEIRDVGAAELPAALDELREGGVRGANVTIPHKLAVAQACDVLDDDAAVLAAVNTVVAGGDRLRGGNTDARGFELALREEGMWPEPGCEAVVLGAGGAAAAVVLALCRVPARRVMVVGRSHERAEGLAARLRSQGGVETVVWERAAVAAALASADLVVNATPAGVGAMPFDVASLPAGCSVVDIRYRPRPVDLVAEARAAGHRAADGVEMLLQQGMLSFRRWTGCEPPYAEARAALHGALAS